MLFLKKISEIIFQTPAFEPSKCIVFFSSLASNEMMMVLHSRESYTPSGRSPTVAYYFWFFSCYTGNLCQVYFIHLYAYKKGSLSAHILECV